MARQALDFKKVSTLPVGSLIKGAVYFDDSTNLIHVATGASTYTTYSGVKDITWNASNCILTVVGPKNTSTELDFSNLTTEEELIAALNALRSGIGFAAGANNYGTGIPDTSYLTDSSTVIGALKTLDEELGKVATEAGVISVGGAQGRINIKGDGSANGDVNLTIDTNTNTLQAAIVGLGTAAFTDASAYDVSGAAAEVLGTGTDTSAANTVYGAKQKAEDVKNELLGTSSDTSTAKTIEGLIKRINETSTESELHLYSGTSGTTDASTVTADGQTYRLVQGSGDTANEVARFNIEKDSFVSDGSVVVHDSSSEPWGPAGTYIQLALRTTDTSTGGTAEKIIYIPATSLVNIYTAENTGHTATVSINGYKISADVSVESGTSQLNFNGNDVTIGTVAGTALKAKLDTLETVAANTAGGVQLTESGNVLSASLIDNAVTTAKIANDNVTTEKLDSSVRTALDKANNSIQSVTGETAVTNSSYIEVSVESATDASKNVALTSHANVTMQNVSTATASANGLATALDVKNYVNTYVSEQLCWSEFSEPSNS